MLDEQQLQLAAATDVWSLRSSFVNIVVNRIYAQESSYIQMFSLRSRSLPVVHPFSQVISPPD
jgi:hypothetical protein